jgi:hypothetical protein
MSGKISHKCADESRLTSASRRAVPYVSSGELGWVFLPTLGPIIGSSPAVGHVTDSPAARHHFQFQGLWCALCAQPDPRDGALVAQALLLILAGAYFGCQIVRATHRSQVHNRAFCGVGISSLP